LKDCVLLLDFSQVISFFFTVRENQPVSQGVP